MTTIPGPVEVANTVKAKNGLSFPVVEDTDIWGGFQVVATIAERDAIPTEKLKVGMRASVQADGFAYKLTAISPLTWVIDTGGGGATDGDKGDITVSGGGTTWTIDSAVVTNAKLAAVPTATIKGRTTAGTGAPEDLTGTQVTALLSVFTSSLKGLAPASGGGTTNYLRADGVWTTIPTSSLTGILGVANGGTGTGTALTSGSIVFAGASGVYAQDNANLFWNDTDNRLGLGTNIPANKLDVVAGTLASGQQALKTTATLAAPVANSYETANYFSVIPQGSSDGFVVAQVAELATGYTGVGRTVGFSTQNNAEGTGVLAFTPFTGALKANFGAILSVATTTGTTPTGSGTRVGALGYSGGSSTLSVGIQGLSLGNAGKSVGVYGGSIRSAGSNNIIGGYFSLYTDASPFTASLVNTDAALIADNGPQAASIFLARDNGTAAFTIADGGYVTARNTSDSTTAFQVQNATGTTILGIDTKNQRLGINTNTPAATAHIVGDNTVHGLRATKASSNTTLNADASGVVLANTDTTNNNYYTLTLASNGTGGSLVQGAALWGVFTNHGVSTLSADLAFGTTSAASAATERMRITAGGSVGIGTSNPTDFFSVGSSSQFRVSSSGNLTRINNIAYSWPASQASVNGQVLSNDASGNLSWVVPQALKTPISTKTANYLVTTFDGTILVNAASGAVTITLPSAASANEYHFTIKKIDTSSNTVTIAGTIDGTTNYVLYSQHEAVRVQSDGSAYWII
jgi:hypothetical protein